MFKVKQTTRPGFSLIELVLVVMVLAILAGLVIPLIGNFTPGGEKSEKQIVTETSMLAIRDAILGTSTSFGAWSDLGQQPALFPTDPFWLTLKYEQLSSLAPHIYAKGPFDPGTKIGWRGPYLKGGFRDSEDSTAFRDGWNKSLTIFVPDTNEDSVIDSSEITYARLVSTGEDLTLQTVEENTKKYIPGGTDTDTRLTLADCGDDIVLFFLVGDTRE